MKSQNLMYDIRTFIIDKTNFKVNDGTFWSEATDLLIYTENGNMRIFVSCYESDELRNKMMFLFDHSGTSYSFTVTFKTLKSFKAQYKKLIGKYRKVRLEYIEKEIEMLNKLFTK